MDDSTAVVLLCAIREHSGLELAEVREAGKYGADAGWVGFTYTSDCVSFYEDNRATIWQALSDDAEEFGYSNVPAFVGSFNSADLAHDEDGFATLCAWYVLESVGRWLIDRRDNR